MKNYYLDIEMCLVIISCLPIIVLWVMALQSNYFIVYVLAVIATIVMVSMMYICVSELISNIKDYRRSKK